MHGLTSEGVCTLMTYGDQENRGEHLENLVEVFKHLELRISSFHSSCHQLSIWRHLCIGHELSKKKVQAVVDAYASRDVSHPTSFLLAGTAMLPTTKRSQVELGKRSGGGFRKS